MTEHANIKIRQLLEVDNRIRNLEKKFNSDRTYSNFFELRNAKQRAGEDIDTPNDLQKMFLTAVEDLLSEKTKFRDQIVGKYKKGTVVISNSPNFGTGSVKALFGKHIIQHHGTLYGSDGNIHVLAHNSTNYGPAPGLSITVEYGWHKGTGLSRRLPSEALINHEDPEDVLKELIRLGKVELPVLKRRYYANQRSGR